MFGVITALALFLAPAHASAEVTLLHEFVFSDGANPSVYSKLLKDGDIFYGMTYAGGDLGLGTIFK
ncbi:MAG: hypothetical protein KBD24_04320 [Candidatus Pacebacteria bacterium]|nr:hypothetical protein [Candidatus Paceibacterota bacterium]